MTCPNCSAPHARVIESRRTPGGQRRRRVACQECEFRWTLIDERPAPSPTKPGPLTDAALRDILGSDDTIVALATRHRRRAETIHAIRRGTLHTDRLPEIPRRLDGPSCLNCTHWTGRCGMGYPDPLEEGLGFAADCALYEVA